MNSKVRGYDWVSQKAKSFANTYKEIFMNHPLWNRQKTVLYVLLSTILSSLCVQRHILINIITNFGVFRMASGIYIILIYNTINIYTNTHRFSCVFTRKQLCHILFTSPNLSPYDISLYTEPASRFKGSWFDSKSASQVELKNMAKNAFQKCSDGL